MLTKLARRILVVLGLSASMAMVATQASAHAQLLKSEPAKDASVDAPAMIQLHFDDELEMKFSSFKLTDLDGKVIPTKATTPPDPKSLGAMPTAPLEPGLYTVSWTAASKDDGHKMTGTFSFTVK